MQTYRVTPPDRFHPAEYFGPYTPIEARRPTPRRATVIYSEDGEVAIDLCAGPNALGECHRTRTANGCVQCAGLWLGGTGWKFKAADDAVACPLAMLGLA